MCHPHTSVVKVSKFGSEQFSFFFMPQRTLWKISECMLNSQSKVISHLTLYANNWLRFLYGPNPSTLSRQLLPPWARSYSSSTSCQEVGIVAYVSSSMSVHEGERGGWEQAVGEKNSQRAEGERAFTEFRFCVLTADAAEPTHKLMREGKRSHFNH